MNDKLQYLINRFILFPPYELWVWLGENLSFYNISYMERYTELEKAKKHLIKAFQKTKKENPKMFEGYDFDE